MVIPIAAQGAMKHLSLCWNNHSLNTVINRRNATMFRSSKKPGTGPVRKRKQHSGSHCPGRSGASAGPSSSQQPAPAVNNNGANPAQVNNGAAPAPGVPPAPPMPNWSNRAQRAPPAHANNAKRGGPNAKAKGGAKSGQARTIANAISNGIKTYGRTDWYTKAVKAGFKNRAALDKFNDVVRNVAFNIDPMCVPVCQECGSSDMLLCEHFIVPDLGVIDTDGAVVTIPQQRSFAVNWRFMWVDRVRRMFTWPRFDSGAAVNHYTNGFDPEQIPDSEIWPELYYYLRLHHNTSYVIDGSYCHEAKLAHSKKLALQFLTDMKIKKVELLSPELINKFHHTIAVACYQEDDQTLFKKRNMAWNFWPAPEALFPSRRVVITGLVILSPWLVSSLVTASMKLKYWIACRFVQTNAPILGNGSALVLKFTLYTVKTTVSAFAQSIWNILVPDSLKEILQSSCRTAGTMSSNLCASAISRTHQLPSLGQLTTDSLTALSRIWPPRSEPTCEFTSGLYRSLPGMSVMMPIIRRPVMMFTEYQMQRACLLNTIMLGGTHLSV